MYWKYLALTQLGNEITGIYKGTKKDVLSYLRENNLTTLYIRPDISQSIKTLFKKSKLKSIELSIFFKDFGNMLKIGLSINEVMVSLLETTKDEQTKGAISSIAKDLEQGIALTTAFEKTKLFPQIAISSLSVGEKSGKLPYVLENLSEYFRDKDILKKKVLGAFTYPLFIFLLIMIASYVIATQLIPQLKDLLPKASLDKVSIRFVLGLADLLTNHMLLLLMIPISFAGGLVYLMQKHSAKIIEKLYSLPLIGTLLKEIAFSRYFLNLSTYIKSGIPLTQAMSLIYTAESNYVTSKFMEIRTRILNGAMFWQAIKASDFFPCHIYFTISRGEKQGCLGQYLFNLYLDYSEKIKTTINAMVAMINPALLIISMLLILFLFLTFLVPIYSNLSELTETTYK